ncbi:uncharacterized protein LOC124672924 [Lolium rigidum]|uniref:uncharacterized protein LOC124672924 n=1 Tax=Lolium rigidum TaxID=89674 RepID=UPI001F5D297B|nr:uncharacterized protein LOC124672924 [Lolium rigidum]
MDERAMSPGRAPQNRHPGPPRSAEIDAAGAVRVRTTGHRSSKLRRTHAAETNGATCQQGDVSHGAQNTREQLSFENLPEDIVHLIHSLLHVQDAARSACVSRVLLRSWRCYSDLMLADRTLGLTDKKSEEIETNLIDKVDRIIENHYRNGVKVKTLDLDLFGYNNINASYLDRWLHISVKSGIEIEVLNLIMYPFMDDSYYSFPSSVLSDTAAASSIQSIFLMYCAFCPTSTLGCLKRLKSLDLSRVRITDEGLGHLLSKCFALERLVVNGCTGIIFLRIPCTLQQLKLLHITTCETMQVIEIDAPKLCTLYYSGGPLVEISIKNSSQLKNVSFWFNYLFAPGILSYARARLPSITPNVESLTLRSHKENVDTPMLSSKLINLKKLEIGLCASVQAVSPSYDVFSLLSFLDASPALDSFLLSVSRCPHLPGLSIT